MRVDSSVLKGVFWATPGVRRTKNASRRTNGVQVSWDASPNIQGIHLGVSPNILSVHLGHMLRVLFKVKTKIA